VKAQEIRMLIIPLLVFLFTVGKATTADCEKEF
jgi:hypothetical protein